MSILGAITGTSKAKITLGGYPSAYGMVDSVLGSVLGGSASDETVTFELPYNPSTLRFRAMAGGNAQKVGIGGAVQYGDIPPRIEISFTAIIENVNTADAFGVLSATNSTRGSALSVATTLGSSIYNKITGSSYSIAPYVEGLLAALYDTKHSRIWFQWGTMEYGGSLTAANARYTMFNTSGQPIKAELDIRMVATSGADSDTSVSAQWEAKYKSAMGELSGSSVSSALSAVSNLVNG